MGFEFDKEVLKNFKITVCKSTLKEIYNVQENGNGKSTPVTRRKGVYAILYKGELKKIGRAIVGEGIFTRMSQYYRQKDGTIKEINDANKDDIEVWYFTLDVDKDCWAAEKLLQAIAYYSGEKMEWDKEIKEQ